MNRFRTLVALAILAVPMVSQAQVSRPDLMYCGTTSATGAELYTGVGPFNEVVDCTPTSSTQALLVIRNGNIAGQGATWLDYLNNGGIIITEYSISDNVYNEIYGTAYPQGTISGDCLDNSMPSLKFDPSGPFWQAVQIPETPENLEACGYSINAIVDGEAPVSALGGWVSNGLVNFAARAQGSGTLFLLDADWRDGQTQYSDDSRAFMGALIAGGIFEAGPATATFLVTKAFSDGNDESVEVTLTCNGGSPLTQSFTISPSLDVTFTLSDIPDSAVNCTVTETAGVDGYTPSYNNGSTVSETSCAWSNVVGGSYTCAITNSPALFDFVVDFEWDDTAEEATGTVDVSLYCTNVLNPDGSLDASTRVSSGYQATATTDTEFSWLDVGGINDDEDDDGPVNPTTCWATASGVSDSAVEVSGCDPFTVSPGDDEANCTMTASVFFEGIPTLSQYGLAIMALLMLGVGFVGFRRFV